MMNSQHTHLNVDTLKGAVGFLPLFGSKPKKSGIGAQGKPPGQLLLEARLRTTARPWSIRL
jgi:hypothetical protein